MKVLLVDDERDILVQGKKFLEKIDDRFDVRTAPSVSEGLEILNMDFDAVISDYKMPDMDGLDFLEVVRSMGYELPFIIFTGKAGKKTALEAMKLGADHFVMKGDDPRKQYKGFADKFLEKI